MNGFNLSVHLATDDLISRLGIAGTVLVRGLPSGLSRLSAPLLRHILWMAAPDPHLYFHSENMLQSFESLTVVQLKMKLRDHKSRPSTSGYKSDLVDRLQHLVAAEHWPRRVVVSGAGSDMVNGEYELLLRNERAHPIWNLISDNVIWLKIGDGPPPPIVYIFQTSSGRWLIRAIESYTMTDFIKCDFYITKGIAPSYKHPFNNSVWKRYKRRDSLAPASKRPIPSVRLKNIVGTIAERRTWGLVMELIMRPLARKFGQLEVAPGMSLSVPDATAFTWCVRHFRDFEKRRGKQKKQTSDFLRVKTRWRKSRAKTWVALVSGGSDY